jgi:hypothetical protein
MLASDQPQTAFVRTVRAALAGGCSLGALEETLVAAGHGRDEAAAAWLYAWSYDAVGPSGTSLELRLTHGTMESLR